MFIIYEDRLWGNRQHYLVKVYIILYIIAFDGNCLIFFSSVAFVVVSERVVCKLCAVIKNHKGKFDIGTTFGARWQRSMGLLSLARVIRLKFLLIFLLYNETVE